MTRSAPGPIGRLVAWSCRHARALVAASVLLAGVSGLYAARTFAMSTDTEALISASEPWRRDAAALSRAFPGRDEDITVVVDGRTPELAEDAAATLAARLEPRRDLFTGVERPGGGAFFDREGLLFSTPAEVRKITADLMAAQPVLGPIAADPSLRGVMGGLSAAVAGVRQSPGAASELARVERGVSFVLEHVAAGRPAALSWRALLSGEPTDASDLRRFIVLRPRIDYGRLTPGAEASGLLRTLTRTLGLTPDRGVSVRLTGSVPLNDEELRSLGDALGPIAAAMFGGVVLMLYFAVKSARLIACILATVAVGLLVTAAFGLLLFHEYNLISVAFFPLFVGLGVDFAIQFAVRYRIERTVEPVVPRALAEAGRGAGGGLALAAGATGIGFLAFLPTGYVGVSQLGAVAGFGMGLAFLLCLTLLPALIVLVRPRGEAVDVGFYALAKADGWVARRRKTLLGGFAALGLAAALLTPFVRVDLDPMSLRDPKSESVATLRDLSRDADTSPNALDALAPSLPAAQALAAKLSALPEVEKAATLASFVPPHQAETLAVLADARALLDPVLNPFEVAPAPTDAELVAALRATAADLGQGAALGVAAGESARLAARLERLAAGPPALRASAQATLTAGLPRLVARLGAALTAEPITLTSLPPEIRREWLAPDGRARVQVFPRGNEADPRVLRRFTAAVRRLAPNAAGLPVAVQESGRTILAAFAQAGGLAALAIGVLLGAVLRSVRQVLLTLAPVALTTLLTLGSCGVLGRSLNLENLIALPLMLGIGVAFNIYFVMAWREGEARLLASSLTRAVLFSALTTACAVGSLWLSTHPGTAGMGELLLISLFWTLVTALVFEPALLGRPPPRAPARP